MSEGFVNREAIIRIPVGENQKLAALVEAVNRDEELIQIWRCANINAVDRSGMSDHGPVHVQKVANGALRLLRLLVEGGVTPSVMANYGLTTEDAEIVVVGGALLHDVGMAMMRHEHESLAPAIAWDKARELLSPLYPATPRTIMASEILHAILAHRSDAQCLTIEAGVVKVADALDMTQGRSRIPFDFGSVNIHSVSAQAIERVEIHHGQQKPVRVDIFMNNSAGIFQVDELLKKKLKSSSIAQYVEVSAQVTGESERSLGIVYSL